MYLGGRPGYGLHHPAPARLMHVCNSGRIETISILQSGCERATLPQLKVTVQIPLGAAHKGKHDT
jgi:hypothetical protein